VQTELVVDVTEKAVPFPDVVKLGVKSPPFSAESGMFTIDTVGVA
jgi:hypothetical protein